MKTTNLLVSGAMAGLVALASSGDALAQAKPAAALKEEGYGVAKKGQNDCGTAKHSCAGKAEADNRPEEWKFVAKGTCEGMKGSLKKPASTESKEPPPVVYGG